VEIVHSLAKWKRQALKTYGFHPGEGLYTDMNAIRRDEETDNIHSIFVDQWDWERIMAPGERNEEFLREIVRKIYLTLRKTEGYVCAHYPHIKPELPDEIAFVTTQELEDRYPEKDPREREYLAGQVLSREDLKYCPHGRPICVVLTQKQLEKQFKRIV
jgi:aspartate--ammonia ligase